MHILIGSRSSTLSITFKFFSIDHFLKEKLSHVTEFKAANKPCTKFTSANKIT